MDQEVAMEKRTIKERYRNENTPVHTVVLWDRANSTVTVNGITFTCNNELVKRITQPCQKEKPNTP